MSRRTATFGVAGFLVVDANSIDIDEPRVIGMKDNVTTLIPIGIAWTREQLAGNGKCCGARDPISLLHTLKFLSHR